MQDASQPKAHEESRRLLHGILKQNPVRGTWRPHIVARHFTLLSLCFLFASGCRHIDPAPESRSVTIKFKLERASVKKMKPGGTLRLWIKYEGGAEWVPDKDYWAIQRGEEIVFPLVAKDCDGVIQSLIVDDHGTILNDGRAIRDVQVAGTGGVFDGSGLRKFEYFRKRPPGGWEY